MVSISSSGAAMKPEASGMAGSRIIAPGASSRVLETRLIRARAKTRPIAFLVEKQVTASGKKIARLNDHGNGSTATALTETTRPTAMNDPTVPGTAVFLFSSQRRTTTTEKDNGEE
jgi:hypothetical protein